MNIDPWVRVHNPLPGGVTYYLHPHYRKPGNVRVPTIMETIASIRVYDFDGCEYHFATLDEAKAVGLALVRMTS